MKKNVLIPVLLTLLLAGAPSAFALMVGISATWDSSFAYDPDTNPYGLQEGSIVQVVAIQSGYNEPGGSDAAYHFEQYGTTSGDLDDNRVFLADTTKEPGNAIVYTGQLTPTANGGYQLKTYVYLDNVSSYDRIYIRVFSATEFEEGEVGTSAWGVGTVQTFDSGPGIVDVLSWNNVDLANTNYFEVIPEPGTLGLLWSGMLGIGAAGLCRRARRKEPGCAEKTGDGKP